MSPGWLTRARDVLYPYRPRFRDRRFWAVQLLVLLVAQIHAGIESARLLGLVPAETGSLDFVPVALFFVPVVYAALNFGLAGAVATALWCTVLTIPNVLVFHEGLERLAELTQISTVIWVGAFVGERRDRERRARERERAATAALRASEERYRGLFEWSRAAVLVLDQEGRIVEANPAAGTMFGRGTDELRGLALGDLVGRTAPELLASLTDARLAAPELVLRTEKGTDLYLESLFTRIDHGAGEPIVQVMLRDVTAERQRQAGLRAYAAHVLQAQEEERRRMAQELHDDAVQALILLCRQLDAAEGACAAGEGGLPAEAGVRLAAARSTAEGVVQGLRDFARALRPPTLDDLGLPVSVRKLVEDLATRAGANVQFKAVGQERRLGPDAELGLFRIAQEALRNVERHAQAGHVTVLLCYEREGVALEVLDDGAGFVAPRDLAGAAAAGGLGLLGMKERAELLGGSLGIVSSPGHGTRVTARLPVQGPAPAAAVP